ncbi:hypothetical protein KC321_g63 [Hortaea werneckii]|nr:hypothetical protein KC321_g63 [Hortaea werneckii]
MRYKEKCNLTGVIIENAYSDELVNYVHVVMTALKVHGVVLDRYLSEGLEVGPEEFGLMTGKYLPFAPYWIKGNTLAEHCESGRIKRPTLALTAKSKKATDIILAKRLSFGGRHHKVEKSREQGGGSIYIYMLLWSRPLRLMRQRRQALYMCSARTTKDHTQRHHYTIPERDRADKLASRKGPEGAASRYEIGDGIRCVAASQPTSCEPNILGHTDEAKQQRKLFGRAKHAHNDGRICSDNSNAVISHSLVVRNLTAIGGPTCLKCGSVVPDLSARPLRYSLMLLMTS